MKKKVDFVKEVLDDPETFGKFTIQKYHYDSGQWYGHAVDRIGMTHIRWNTGGHSVTYFGEELEPNIGVEIKKDGSTRTVFNGYCFTKEEFQLIMKLTW